jgi:hypothetical protein
VAEEDPPRLSCKSLAVCALKLTYLIWKFVGHGIFLTDATGTDLTGHQRVNTSYASRVSVRIYGDTRSSDFILLIHTTRVFCEDVEIAGDVSTWRTSNLKIDFTPYGVREHVGASVSGWTPTTLDGPK